MICSVIILLPTHCRTAVCSFHCLQYRGRVADEPERFEISKRMENNDSLTARDSNIIRRLNSKRKPAQRRSFYRAAAMSRENLYFHLAYVLELESDTEKQPNASFASVQVSTVFGKYRHHHCHPTGEPCYALVLRYCIVHVARSMMMFTSTRNATCTHNASACTVQRGEMGGMTMRTYQAPRLYLRMHTVCTTNNCP